MRLLLDTHAALWWAAGDPRLGTDALASLEDETNPVYLSAVVLWEIAIKRGRGRLEAPRDLADRLVSAGVTGLPVSLEHAQATEHLPPIHADPFDRLLVAQARVEGATIVTRDPRLAAYDVRTAW